MTVCLANLQWVLVSQGERLLLQLGHFLLTLLAKASLLLRLGDGHGPRAFRWRPAAAPRLLRWVKSFPGGYRRLSARTSLHLQNENKLWLTCLKKHQLVERVKTWEWNVFFCFGAVNAEHLSQVRWCRFRGFRRTGGSFTRSSSENKTLSKTSCDTLTANTRLFESPGAGSPPKELILPLRSWIHLRENFFAKKHQT